MLFLDSQHRLIALEMFRGTLTRTNPREELRACTTTRVRHPGHNHPSGHVQASAADRAVTHCRLPWAWWTSRCWTM